MKIQINTKEGLYQLIASDKELEIEIKKAIINDFAKNYIKSVANSEIIQKLKYEILDELRKNNYFEVKKSIGYSEFLSDGIKNKIKQEVDKAIHNEISNQIMNMKLELFNEIKQSIQEKLSVYDNEDKLVSIIKQVIENKCQTIINKLG